MKLALASQRPAVRQRGARFYCVELFDGWTVTGIEFFDVHELPDARRSAVAAVQRGIAEHARITDDAGRLVFRPAFRAPASPCRPD